MRISLTKKTTLLAITILLGFTTNTTAKTYPEIYPYIPFKTSNIISSVKKISEDEQPVLNFNEIIEQSLSRAQTKEKPWTSSFWPLNKGLIADSYESSFFGYYFERGSISWTRNYNVFQKRKNGVLQNIDRLTEGQLATLAPSEKYDILMGDYNFDLTNRLWDFMQKWGNRKEHSFLSNLMLVGNDALDIAQKMVANGWYNTTDEAFLDAFQLRGTLAVEIALNMVKSGAYNSVEDAMPEAIEVAMEESRHYVLEKRNNLMAWWEGICHGWATAAGNVKRPRKAVDFTLPDGRRLRFYPSDIKGLISLLWANSLVQDLKFVNPETKEESGGGVISEGMRCNLKNPGVDQWGRLYDNQPDPFSGGLNPRCVGVHPAIWHLSLVNLIGKQGRSFVVDRKVGEEVDNHPMWSYKMYYFHPYTGRFSKDIKKLIAPIDRNDYFRSFRNPDAKYLIGVKTYMTYIDWARPKRFLTDHEKYDKIKTKDMFYDLELDEDYNIIGGQWRASVYQDNDVDKFDTFDNGDLNHNQPDFLWVISKNHKKFFKADPDLEEWSDKTVTPPASWRNAALDAQSFIYHEKYSYGTGRKCNMYDSRTGKKRVVSCEFEVPKPQPLVDVIN
ncbi:MAG: hypothetical protein OEW87_13960, partial [Flavobacteriaceae bacterium]|nr:hypothetical protein [Flavobacteriaceae bacterium]